MADPSAGSGGSTGAGASTGTGGSAATGGTAVGRFVWRELMTDDVNVAHHFLGELFSWTWKSMDMGLHGTYWIAGCGGRDVGGLMAKPPAMGIPTAWSSYVVVDSVDGAASRATAAGGKVLVPPTYVPGVGRFAGLMDPWGAVLMPFVPASSEGAPPDGPPPSGAFCWETLVTPSPKAAVDWYRGVVGFGSAPAPNGHGSVFTAGSAFVADVQPAPAGSPSYWATYVAVEDVVATRDRASRLGGKVIVPRVDVPQVGTFAVIADPTGGALGIFQAGGH